MDAAGGVDTLGDHGHAAENVGQAFAATETLADAPIAAMRTDARGNEVAQSCESRESLRDGTVSNAEASHLHKAAGYQGRAGIIAETQTVADAGSEANDILQRAAKFHTDEIRIGVNSKSIRVEAALDELGQFEIGTGYDHGSRLAAGHFLGVARATEDGHALDAEDRSKDLAGSGERWYSRRPWPG